MELNIKIFCSWDLKFDLYHEKQIELYVDRVPNDVVPKNTVRFIFLLEPPEIMRALQDQALAAVEQGRANYLLTHNQDLIDRSDKAYLQEFATSWIRNFEEPEQKNFEVSTLIGGKLMAQGHHLRQTVLNRKNEFTVPNKFWISNNFPPRNNPNAAGQPILMGGKEEMFVSQFHIVIENASRRNWFTEKIMDAIQTKTVPIYWGCPNIGDWFDTRGMILVENIEDIISECNKLTPETYEAMKPYVEKNFEISKKYLDLGKNLKEKIINFLENDRSA